MVDNDSGIISIAAHAKLENLKRMAREVMLEANLPVEQLDEDDMALLINYFDNVCKDLNEIEDELQKLHYLLKIIVVNAGVVIMKSKELRELKDD